MATKINKILSTNLVRIRLSNRYSQKEISEVLGITQPSYNRMESGTTCIRAERLYKLAQFYEVLVDLFFHEKPVYNRDRPDLTKEVMLLEERVKKIEKIGRAS